jgi:von Willebrand factor A domain-containing protein 8
LGADNDVLLHPNFRLILLANRPGFPFLGNEFLQVLGEGFSCYVVSNPDLASEVRLLQQAAPSVSENLIRKLDLAFHDLRQAFVDGLVTYPYSLRELLHIVKHLHNYPQESLTAVLLNTLAFDLHRPEAIQYVVQILKKRGLDTDGLSLAEIRDSVGALGKEAKRIEFDPKKAGRDTSLDKPKIGKTDPENKPHVGGNTWRGGTGGRDTAGLGGVGGFERLFAGHDVNQVPQSQKDAVPEHIRRQAREMAREALAKKLAEDGMTSHEGATYHSYVTEMAPQIEHLRNIFDSVQANAKERQWLNRQQEGELDERRLTDGLTGERAIFRRRQEAPPEIGAPQTKPKRIRFIVDVSASMYSMQFDGRLEREIKTCVVSLLPAEELCRRTYQIIAA